MYHNNSCIIAYFLIEREREKKKEIDRALEQNHAFIS